MRFNPDARQVCDACGQEQPLTTFTYSRGSRETVCKPCKAEMAVDGLVITTPGGVRGLITAIEDDGRGNVSRVKVSFLGNTHAGWLAVVNDPPPRLPLRAGCANEGEVDPS